MLQSKGSKRVGHDLATEQHHHHHHLSVLSSRKRTALRTQRKRNHPRECPGSPVVKILHFHCHGLRFNSWFGD